MSLFVTLYIQVILMNERRCRIMKACSFFTCLLYTVQATARYPRVDSTIARYILLLTRLDTWWLFIVSGVFGRKMHLPWSLLLIRVCSSWSLGWNQSWCVLSGLANICLGCVVYDLLQSSPFLVWC